MLKKIIVLLLIILFTGHIPILADKLVTFTDFIYPDNLLIFDNLLYITEDAVIFQYSMKDFALNKKFGREGEGPREFFINWKGGNDMIMISIHDNQLVVNSWGKLTYFTKEGNYVMERRIPANVGQWFSCLGNGFVGRKYIRENDGLQYHGIVLYDSNFSPIRFIYKQVHGVQWHLKKPFNPLTIDQAQFEVADNKIFVIDGDRTTVTVFDQAGEKLFTVTNPDKAVPYDEEDKKKEIESMKSDKFWSRVYETRKNLFRWPSSWPLLRTFLLDESDKKIYLQTHESKGDKLKYIVYGFNSSFIKSVFLPYQGRIVINGGRIYQLLENEETETWELQVK